MTLDGHLIGQNMFMKAVIVADVLHRSLKGKGMERFYWIILQKKQKNLDAEHYVLKEILIFMGKADLNKQVNLVFVTMVWKKGMMLHSFYVKN